MLDFTKNEMEKEDEKLSTSSFSIFNILPIFSESYSTGCSEASQSIIFYLKYKPIPLCTLLVFLEWTWTPLKAK